MNSFKTFFKEKGLYLVCLALVFAATITGILAIRSVVRNVSDLTQAKQNALEEDSQWNAPDAAVNNPVTDLPEETPKPSSTPAVSSSPAASSSGGSSRQAAESSEPAEPSVSSALSDAWANSPLGAEPSAAFSGDELVFNETLGDWRTHNGADYACQSGDSIPAILGGTVAAVYEDVLWGGIVEVTDQNGITWRYCGVQDPAVESGSQVEAGTTLGTAGAIPSESRAGTHIHLECLSEGSYLDPEEEKPGK